MRSIPGPTDPAVETKGPSQRAKEVVGVRTVTAADFKALRLKPGPTTRGKSEKSEGLTPRRQTEKAPTKKKLRDCKGREGPAGEENKPRRQQTGQTETVKRARKGKGGEGGAG